MQQYPKYSVTASEELDVIEFISVGIKGNIEKIIHIEATDNPLIYNLAFGDKKLIIKDTMILTSFDDKINSENGDRDIVLATVTGVVFDYTSKYPERWIFFKGSDEARMRLYRMAISKNYKE